MNTDRKGILILLMAASLVATGWGPVRGQSLRVTGEKTFLLLNNGRVLHGTVRQTGDRVLLELDDTAQIGVRAKDIRFSAPELLQLYEFKLSQISNGNAGDHLEIAQWCLEQGLLIAAEPHYQELKSRIGSSSRFQVFEKQYKSKLIEKLRRASESPSSPSHQPSMQDQASPPSKSDAPAKSEDSIVVKISPSCAKEYFDRILPILRNRCGQTACHGMNTTTGFFVPPEGNHTPALGERSLKSALSWIRVEATSESPLLQMATAPHSLQGYPAISRTDEKDIQLVARLEAWIASTAHPAPAAGQSHVDKARFSQTVDSSRVVTASGKSRTGVQELQPNMQVGEAELSRLEEAILRLETVEKASSKSDPYDPEKFNQRRK
jgi:hypothetical protein